MDEPDPKSAAKEAVADTPVADAPAPLAEESSVARGSQVIAISPQRSERREQSVVDMLPEMKTERIASMRRELADLQQHLIVAQQRVATELKGRAEDAERLEALENFVQEHEQKRTRAEELETEVAALRRQLATAATTTEDLRREIVKHEEAIRRHRADLDMRSASANEAKTLLEARDVELDDHRKQLRSVTEQLDLQFTSLRDAKALIAALTSEVATVTSERDVLKGELEPARGELEVARTKLRDVANHLVRLGQDLSDGGVSTPTSEGSDPWITTTGVKPAAVAIAASEPKPAPAKRPSMPPPVPGSPSQARAAVPAPVEVETIVMTEEAKPASRIGALVFGLGGVILGCVVTIVIMKSSGSSSADDQVAPTPAAAPVEPGPVIRAEQVRPSAPAPATAVNVEPKLDTPKTPPAPATTTDGVIVLPASAVGHRLFVDGKIVEVKDSRASIPCGSHEVRIGSSGTARTLDVTCGGETAILDEPR